MLCAYIWKAFQDFLCVFPDVFTKDIDNYKTNHKLNKTKLRFIKVTYPWSLPMTGMASKLSKSKRFCAIKGDNVISSIGAPLQTLGAPNTPLWIVHSDLKAKVWWYLISRTGKSTCPYAMLRLYLKAANITDSDECYICISVTYCSRYKT